MQTTADVVYNYYALCTAILVPNISIDTAISRFSPVTGKTPKKTNTEEVAAMAKLREQGMTYRAIGEIYGAGADATYLRIKKYKQRVREAGVNETTETTA